MNDKQIMEQMHAKQDLRAAMSKMLETSDTEFKVFVDRMEKTCTENPLWLALKKELEGGRQLLKHQQQLDKALKDALNPLVTLVK